MSNDAIFSEIRQFHRFIYTCLLFYEKLQIAALKSWADKDVRQVILVSVSKSLFPAFL